MANSRKLFEEVSDDARPAQAAQPGLIDRAGGGDRRATRIWLLILFGLVVVMIAVGGLTRLTDSGLSITEWRPLTGAIPPTSPEVWQAEFEKDKQIPEFQIQNSAMTLSDFKTIYWWEWGHRQLGRVLGLVWAIGFFGLLASRRMPRGWTGRLLGLGVLGGLQGAIGWWMVSSGLSGRMVDVASYRLAIHLGLAFAILGLLAWFALKLGRSDHDLMQARRAREGKLFGMSTGLLHLAYVQILIGALVAGIDAGRNFTDWPLMAGAFLPPGLFDLSPFWSNFFENAGLVQFIHRMVGYLVLIFAFVVWRRSRASGNAATKRAFDWAMVAVFGQVVLGIGTVLYAAPVSLALVHQLGAVAAITLILRARFLAQYPQTQAIRA